MPNKAAFPWNNIFKHAILYTGMDFKQVLSFLTSEFNKHNIDYALIGGFALGILGIMRTTMDMDFLVQKDDVEKVKAVLENYTYKCIYITENVSQYVSDIDSHGTLDFIHAFRPISLRMLKEKQIKTIYNGDMAIPVLKPEDIIGLKVQALANNPKREELDKSDIKAILEKYREHVDWSRLKEYFALFSLTEYYEELQKEYKT